MVRVRRAYTALSQSASDDEQPSVDDEPTHPTVVLTDQSTESSGSSVRPRLRARVGHAVFITLLTIASASLFYLSTVTVTSSPTLEWNRPRPTSASSDTPEPSRTSESIPCPAVSARHQHDGLDVDPYYLPPQGRQRDRVRLLDQQIPMVWLHSLRRAVEMDEDHPKPPIPLSPLGAFFGNYTVFHAQQLKDMGNHTRFLIHSTWHYSSHGMGNRLLSLVAAFLYAVLTERVLILDWRHSEDQWDLDDLFASPPIDWDFRRLADHYGGNQFILDAKGKHPTLEVNEHWGSENNRLSYEELLCSPLNSTLRQDTQFLAMYGNQYFSPLLIHNVHVRSRLESAGFSAGRLAPPVMRFLLTLVPGLRKKIEDYKAEYWRPYMIGIQVRTKEGHVSGDAMSLLAFKCAKTLTEALPLSWRQRGDVGWYVATDNASMAIMGKALHPQCTQHTPYPLPVSYLDCPQDFSKEGIECAIQHMFLLAEADDLVMTKASTFGDISHAVSMLAPMVTTDQVTCFRQPWVDPCFHHWQQARLLKCYTDQAVNMEDVNGFCVGREFPWENGPPSLPPPPPSVNPLLAHVITYVSVICAVLVLLRLCTRCQRGSDWAMLITEWWMT